MSMPTYIISYSQTLSLPTLFSKLLQKGYQNNHGEVPVVIQTNKQLMFIKIDSKYVDYVDQDICAVIVNNEIN